MFRLKETSCPVSYVSIPFDTSKSCIAMFVAEILYRTLHEEESNAMLFDFCTNAFQVLDWQEAGTANFHLMFMLHFSKYLGIYPAGLLEDLNSELQTDLQVFYDLPEKARIAVVRMLQSDWPALSSIQLDGETRNQVLDKLILFYRTHLQGMFNMKSLQVLKEIFH
jgi:DNA repair protein RecO (recombination protein O)